MRILTTVVIRLIRLVERCKTARRKRSGSVNFVRNVDAFYLPDSDTGLTLTHAIECRLSCSAYPAMAMHAEKNVRCHTNIKQTANPAEESRKNVREHARITSEPAVVPEYRQNICMAGNGLNFPMQKLTMSVTDVMVIDTAASESVLASLSGTSIVTGVLLHATNMTNVSSMPMPEKNKKKKTFRYTFVRLLTKRFGRYDCVIVFTYTINAHGRTLDTIEKAILFQTSTVYRQS